MRPSAIIADDEPALREYLLKLLNENWPDLNIIHQAENGVEALKAIIKHQPEIAFLDIKMPGLSGLEVAEQCKGECHIVFITAYDQYAIEAFENEAIDYLLKPLNRERLLETRKRIEARLQNRPQNLSQLLSHFPEKKRELQWLKVVHQDEVILINIDDVDYFRSGDKYTSAYIKGKEHILRSSLKKLESQLNPNQFWRIHRSTLVKVTAIESINKTLSGQLLIHIGKHQLPVSRAYQGLFKQD